MTNYWGYLKYVFNHRRNMRKVCWSHGKILMGLLHDLDKYLPDEFIPYARYYYGDTSVNNKIKSSYNKAWGKHIKRTKHHWEKFVLSLKQFLNCQYVTETSIFEFQGTSVVLDMPYEAILEMIYDWEAMGMVFGDSAAEYYLKHYAEMFLSKRTRYVVETELKLTSLYELEPMCECDKEYWMTLEELAIELGEEEFRTSMHRLETKYNIPNLYEAVMGRKAEVS